MKSLAQRFNEALLAADLSKKELADAVGISPSAVTQIANGETKELKASVALKIARKLNVDPWWLVLGEGDMQLPESSQLERSSVSFETNASFKPYCSDHHTEATF